MSNDRSGARGGPVPPLTLEDAQALFEAWAALEYGELRKIILRVALLRGEYHADDVAGLELEHPNAIGAAVNALARGGFLEKLNRAGVVEHRKGSSKASHGRASYVWRLSDRGRELAGKLVDVDAAGLDRLTIEELNAADAEKLPTSPAQETMPV